MEKPVISLDTVRQTVQWYNDLQWLGKGFAPAISFLLMRSIYANRDSSLDAITQSQLEAHRADFWGIDVGLPFANL